VAEIPNNAGTGDEGAAIRCQNLGKHYGDIVALSGLDLAIPAGAIFGFLGRNGAGKTTTIRLMTGLASPTTGSAWVAGVETTRADSNARRSFGYLPQAPTFYGWMTAIEYLDYVANLFAMSKPERHERVAEMLSMVGLEEAARRRIRGFSGGMVQRLGIAQALIHRPPVLFLDEPTSALDPAGRYAVLDLIQQLRGRTTVFLSTHILGDAERVCDIVGIIHQGHLVTVAPRDELVAQYATDVAVLELDPASWDAAPALVAELEQLSWVSGVTHDGASLRVAAGDPATARQALLPQLVNQGVVLSRYEWVRPTLEEIFLEISS
jgi:ABC-2 type transport system ATP-binding protein